MKLIFVCDIYFDSPTLKVGLDSLCISTKECSFEKINSLFINLIGKEDIIFVIDVLATIEYNGRILKQQEMGGIIIYRRLLELFDGNQDKLKVIFYSPISREALIKLSKGENYVLKLLPFIQCKYDESFKEELQEIVQNKSANGWDIFNNASENLLSGWALSTQDIGYEQVVIQEGHKILLIDDQLEEWKAVYRTIFKDFENHFTFPSFGMQVEWRDAWKAGIAIPEIQKLADSSTAVLSDLYINENHRDTKYFKTRKDFENISGFQVLTELKEKHPFLPYMMYTSSNKVWNYEVFQSNGIWSWSVKGAELDLIKEDKIHRFEHFESNISALLDEDWSDIRGLWTRFQELRKTWTSKWWVKIFARDKSPLHSMSVLPPLTISSKVIQNDYVNACAKAIEIVDLLGDQFFLLSRDFGSKKEFESINFANVDALVHSAIVVNVGGIVEKLRMKNEKAPYFNVLSSYLSLIRAYYAHDTYFQHAKRSDAILALSCIIELLETSEELKLPIVVRGVNDQITMDLIPKLNYLYYGVLFTIVQNGQLGDIGLKHLQKLIANARLDTAGIGSLQFQTLHNKYVRYIGPSRYRKIDVIPTNYGKAMIKKAANVFNITVK